MNEQVAPAGAVGTASNQIPKKECVMVKIADLKAHPKHAELDKQMSDDEIDKLAQDIKLNGLQIPIEVTPDHDIICGHGRVEAARKLGKTEIKAWVRHDLAAKGESQIEERMITDNLLRKHLDPLSKARYYRRLKELSANLPDAKKRLYQFADNRDVLAKQFNQSGRNMDRLCRILTTPKEVQDAVSNNQLTLQAGGQVAALPAATQKKIAAEIQAGKEPKEVVAPYLPTKKTRHKKVNDARKAAVNSIRVIINDLEDRVGDIKYLATEEAKDLQRMDELLQQILKQAQVLDTDQRDANMQAMLQQFKEDRSRKKTPAVNKNAIGGTGPIELFDEEFLTA
jgi:ParB/RepB/Spo0J family partition protein